MTAMILPNGCDGYKTSLSPSMLARLTQSDPDHLYTYTLRDGEDGGGDVGEDVGEDDKADLANAHDEAEDAGPTSNFKLENCGDLQWFPEFASLFTRQ